MSQGRIPDRWIPYNACGDVIEGTRIICFKVPLHRNVQLGDRKITQIWDIPAVLAEIPKLGAVIDLTNTARYYNPSDFEANSVRHRKILMPGREIPPESKVREFMDAVDEFLGKNCDLLVGVHCTHGLNRTGYMVCRYLKDRLKISGQEAINRFEIARGYKIERENYIASLLGKKIPPPEFGKRTIIQPNAQYYMSEQQHNSRFTNNRYIQNRSRCGNRITSNQYSNYNSSYYTNHNTNYNTNYSTSYNTNYKTYYNSSHRNNSDTSSGYHGWKNGSEGSNYNGQPSRNYYTKNNRGNSFRGKVDRSGAGRSSYEYSNNS